VVDFGSGPELDGEVISFRNVFAGVGIRRALGVMNNQPGPTGYDQHRDHNNYFLNQPKLAKKLLERCPFLHAS
jgi:hypothetical protein